MPAAVVARSLCLLWVLLLTTLPAAAQPASHPPTPAALQAAAEAREAANDLAAAAPLYRAAAQAFARQQNWVAWAENELNEGYAFINLARYPQAQTVADELVTTTTRHLGPRHLLTAKSLKVAGMVAIQVGRYTAARAHYQHALDVALGPPLLDSGFVGAVLRDLGTVCTKYEDAPAAIAYYERALRWLPVTDPRRAVVLADLGAAQQKIGNYPAALEALQAGLRADIAANGADFPLLCFTYNDLGICHQALGDTAEATAHYRRALTLARAGDLEASPVSISVYNELGKLRAQAGDFGGARRCWRHSRALAARAYPPDHPDITQYDLNVGEAFLLQGRPDSARHHFTAALARAGRTTGPASDLAAVALLGLGRTAAASGDLPRARRLLTQARDVAQGARVVVHTVEAERALAGCAPALPDALQHLGAALALLAPGFNPARAPLPTVAQLRPDPLLLAVLADVADRHARAAPTDPHPTSRLRAALDAYRLVADLASRLQALGITDDASLLVGRRHSHQLARAVGVCAALYVRTQSPRYLTEAFGFAEQERARLLRAALARQAALHFGDVPTAVVRHDEQQRAALAWAERQATHSAAASRDAWNTRAVALRQRRAAWLNDTLRRAYPRYYALQHQPPGASVPHLQAALAPDEALVQYVLADRTAYAFVLTRGRADLLVLPFTSAQLAPRVQGLRAALRQLDGPTAFASVARQLYLELVGPLALPTTIRRLAIVPDGLLHHVPFEVLLTADPTPADTYRTFPYLLRGATVRYLPAATSLTAAAAAPSAAEARFAAFAPAATLPAARREATAVADALHGTAYVGAQATAARFRRLAPALAGIHLATHATVDDDDPLGSYLEFAPEDYHSADTAARPGSAPPSPSRLHAWELYGLRLGARLVTLSACNTGAGQVVGGEGVLSLARGFLYAGCARVVMSYWPAPDAATARLMPAFYAALAAGQPTADALRAAKLRYLAEADDPSAAPALWAGLVLIGDGRPLLSGPPPTPWLRWAESVIALTALTGGAWWYGRRRYKAPSSRRARAA